MIKGKEIKKLKLILENTEEIEYDGEYIGILNIHNPIERIESERHRKVNSRYYPDTIMIEIFKEANDNTIYRYDLSRHKIFYDTFNRLLQKKDITTIQIIYTDDTQYTYYLFEEDKDATVDVGINILEDIYLSKVGNLYILLDKQKRTVDQYLIENGELDASKSIYESEEHNSRRKRMYTYLDIVHEFKEDDLPEMYTLVCFYNYDPNTNIDNDNSNKDTMIYKESMGIRVYDDKNNSWRILFLDREEAIEFPKYWTYYTNYEYDYDPTFIETDLLQKYPPYNIRNNLVFTYKKL